MSEVLSSGLTLTIPTLGEQNWSDSIRNNCFIKISEHDHTGSGKGLQLSTNAIQADAITGAKIRLGNNEALKARNVGNSANVELIKLTTSDYVQVGPNTSDASDNSRLYLIGAGDLGTNGSRGAYIILTGNEEGTFTGRMQLTAGSAGYIHLFNYGSQDIKFGTNSTNRWEIDGATGHILPNADNTYDIGDASFNIRNFAITGNIRSSTTINFTNQTTSGSAGALNQYWTVSINGTSFKIPCYDLA